MKVIGPESLFASLHSWRGWALGVQERDWGARGLGAEPSPRVMDEWWLVGRVGNVPTQLIAATTRSICKSGSIVSIDEVEKKVHGTQI